MKILKVECELLGGHYHCKVFIGVPGQTMAKVGDLVFDTDDWKSIGKTYAHGIVFTQAYKQHNKE